MLDDKAELLLKYIRDNCSSGYKILTNQEMLDIFPSFYKLDAENVKQLIKILTLGEYVSNKYSDGEQYCLYCLPKGRNYLESIVEKRVSEKLFKTQVIKLVVFSSLIGSFFAQLLFTIISIIVKKC